MYLSDYTIPEAEVIYQKAVIRGGCLFLAFLVVCVLLYFVVQKIVEDRKDDRSHKWKMAREKSSAIIGQASFDRIPASQSAQIDKLKREVNRMNGILNQRNYHIAMLEETLEKFKLGDVAEKIRKEIEDGKNESKDRS